MAKTESKLIHLLVTLCLQTLIVAGSAEAQNVSFIAPRAFAAGVAPFSVAVSDFNGDGIQDLAVANYSSNNVSVLLGRGDGTFQAAINFGAGAFPFSVAVSDFNDDGLQDVAVAVMAARNSGVSVLINNTPSQRARTWRPQLTGFCLQANCTLPN